jgi:hypothetical protein
MDLRKCLAATLSMGLALAGVPLAAQDYSPNTVWGEAPASATQAAFAVLQDMSGNVVQTVPVAAGMFAFEKVIPGEYTVVLRDAAQSELARSLPAQMTADAVVKAIFASKKPAAYVPSKGGIGTTGWVLIGAGAAGVATTIVVLTNNEEGAASPSR